MGVNMAGNCIIDDEACREASRQEIIRRYYQAIAGVADGTKTEEEAFKIELLMRHEQLSVTDRPAVVAARKREDLTGSPAVALELPDGRMITGKTGELLGPSAAVLLNAIKELAGIPHEKHIISPTAIEPIQKLKTQYLGSKNPLLHTDEVLIALSLPPPKMRTRLALAQLPALKGSQVHSSVMLTAVDRRMFHKLACDVTCEPR